MGFIDHWTTDSDERRTLDELAIARKQERKRLDLILIPANNRPWNDGPHSIERLRNGWIGGERHRHAVARSVEPAGRHGQEVVRMIGKTDIHRHPDLDVARLNFFVVMVRAVFEHEIQSIDRRLPDPAAEQAHAGAMKELIGA